MGNSQKKLGRKKGKDSKKGQPDQEQDHDSESKILEDSQENIQHLMSKGPIEDFYNVNFDIVLGKGHYALVNLGTCKRTGIQVAVKRIQISKSRFEALEREVAVLKKIGTHPNIVTLYDIFITNSELQLVLELLDGGELFDRMVEKGPYSEREASHHIRKIGLALKYLHRHGIVHRDLKPENLLLADKGPNSELKIADFGLSRIVDDVANSTMNTVCGTWAYCAPEVKTTATQSPFDGSQTLACYTASVDLWSVGVILFVILGAYHPFDPDGDASDAQLWERICSGVFDFNDFAWDNISSSAKDLIKKLIVIDPAKRYTTDQLLAHPWVSSAASVPATPITPSIDKSLGGFVIKKKRAMTPKMGFQGGFNQFQQVQVPAELQQNTNQPYVMNNNFQQQAFGASSFAQPPQPQFNQSPLQHQQQQPQQNHVHFQVQEPVQYNQPQYGFAQQQQTQQNDIAIPNQLQHQQVHEPQQNPGVTLDTLTGKDDRMELASPSFK